MGTKSPLIFYPLSEQIFLALLIIPVWRGGQGLALQGESFWVNPELAEGVRSIKTPLSLKILNITLKTNQSYSRTIRFPKKIFAFVAPLT
jgi:hypothetical protein